MAGSRKRGPIDAGPEALRPALLAPGSAAPTVRLRSPHQHVDWLPDAALGLPGRLGLTCAPGLFVAGSPLDPDARLRLALRELVDVHRASLLVTLLEPAEAAERFGPGLVKQASRLRLESLAFPIADGWVPSSMEDSVALAARLLRRLGRGQNVVVHCLAGLGRSGTIAACCLVARGRSAAEAIALVRAARPGAIQTERQEQFVAEFAEAWAQRAG